MIQFWKIWGGSLCYTANKKRKKSYSYSQTFKKILWNIVLFDWESPRPYLCTKLALFNTSWQMLKVLLCFFKLSVNRYGLGLSYDLLFIIIALRAAKLWPVKVGGRMKILAWAFPNPLSLRKSLHVLDFSSTTNFDRSQFCSPLRYDDEK